MLKEIENNPQITLQTLRLKVFQLFGINVSLGTIFNYLEGNFISLKKTHNKPANKERGGSTFSVWAKQFNWVKPSFDYMKPI